MYAVSWVYFFISFLLKWLVITRWWFLLFYNWPYVTKAVKGKPDNRKKKYYVFMWHNIEFHPWFRVTTDFNGRRFPWQKNLLASNAQFKIKSKDGKLND